MAVEKTVAKIENGVVTQVIVCDSPGWAKKRLGGEWVNSTGQNVGVGLTYVKTEGFRPPQPFPSWTWKNKAKGWQPPKERPKATPEKISLFRGKMPSDIRALVSDKALEEAPELWAWDEKTQDWYWSAG